MKRLFKMVLTRAAKKSGGDRYETEDGELVIYFPQSISRQHGGPLRELKLTIEEVME